jgi:hypothetical protein
MAKGKKYTPEHIVCCLRQIEGCGREWQDDAGGLPGSAEAAAVVRSKIFDSCPMDAASPLNPATYTSPMPLATIACHNFWKRSEKIQ